MLIPLTGPVVARQGYYPDGKPFYKEPVSFPGAFVLELKFTGLTLVGSLLKYNQAKLDFISKQSEALEEPPCWIDLGYYDSITIDDCVTYYYQLVYPNYTPPTQKIWINWPDYPQDWQVVSTKTYQDAVREQNESIST